ncbi:MAG: tetratricopeptide repeat protein [Leptonema sp. (in: bacteria)]
MKPQKFIRKKTHEKSSQLTKEAYDPFVNFEGSQFELYLSKAFYFIRDNFKIFASITSIAFFILISIVFYKVYLNYLDKKALLEFEKLEKNPILQPGAGDPKAAIEKLDNYTKQYPIDSAKKRATIKKIQLYEFNKDYEKAAEEYEKLSRLVEYPELKINFLYRSAIHFENLQKYSRALTNIEEIQKYGINNNLINAIVVYTQIRLLDKLGKKEDAKRLAKKILEFDDIENPEIKSIKLRVIAYFLNQ